MNQIAMIGILQFTGAGNSILVGADNINTKACSAIFGQGHENRNRPEGVSAFGKWSQISSNTAMAVGNGTAYNARSNAFEVTTDSGIVLRDSNGARWKITVDTSGNLTTTAL